MGLPDVLAKAVDDAITEVSEPAQRSRTERRESRMGQKERLRQQLAEAQEQLERLQAGAPAQKATPPMSAATALARLSAAAEDAKHSDPNTYEALKRELVVAKWAVAQHMREQGRAPKHSRLGPNSVELFTRTGSLGSDTALGGI